MSKRFKRLQGVSRSTHGGRTHSPGAGARPWGPEHRWRAAGPHQRAARPAPAARRPARAGKGPSRPSGAGGTRVRHLRTPPGRPAVPAPLPRSRSRCPHSPDVPSRPPARHPPQSCGPCPDSAREPTTLASAAPASRNKPCGPPPGVRRGRALRRTEDTHCSNRRGARLRARRSSPVGQEAGGGTLCLMKLVNWSGSSRSGATHMGPKSVKLRQGHSSSGRPFFAGRGRS